MSLISIYEATGSIKTAWSIKKTQASHDGVRLVYRDGVAGHNTTG
jgi:hypothetical protein